VDAYPKRVKESRYEFRRWLETIDIRNLIFIDEMGLNRAMTRLYDERPGNKGQNITLIGAMSDEGLIASMSFPGSLNTDSFLVFMGLLYLG
jgi:hypothetical protein